MQTTQGPNRHPARCHGALEPCEAQGLAVAGAPGRLRGRGKDGAVEQVVAASPAAGRVLPVGGEPDGELRSEVLLGHLGGQGSKAEVRTLGAQGRGQVQAIVDPQPEPRRQLPEAHAKLHEFAIREPWLTQQQPGQSRLERRPEEDEKADCLATPKVARAERQELRRKCLDRSHQVASEGRCMRAGAAASLHFKLSELEQGRTALDEVAELAQEWAQAQGRGRPSELQGVLVQATLHVLARARVLQEGLEHIHLSTTK